MSRSVKDRFKELSNVVDTQINIDEESREVPARFKEVFDKVYIIRNLIGNIRSNTVNIRDTIQSNAAFSTKSVYKQIELKVKDTYDIAFKITNELKSLDVKNSNKKDDGTDKSVINRMKRIQYGSLRQDFQNAMFESNELLEKYRQQKRDIIKKQAALLHIDLENEQLEKLLDTSDCIHLFTDNILLNTKVAKNDLLQIEERHTELLKIEELITEVNGQFKQIAVLVEQQQDNINRIEFFAHDATNYVDQGLLQIEEAQRHKKRTKKKMYIAIICFIIIVLILILIFK